MKRGVKQIIGKRIQGVVAKKRTIQPYSQLFLVFSDGTYFEFYTYLDQICATGNLCRGGLEEVREYMGEEYVILEAFGGKMRETAKKPLLLEIKSNERSPLQGTGSRHSPPGKRPIPRSIL